MFDPGKMLKQLSKGLGKVPLFKTKTGKILLVAILAVLGGILFLFKRRKTKKAEAKTATAGPADLGVGAQPRPPPMRSGALLSVWRTFKSGLPSSFKRSISRFQPFVVLGPAGSGKTQLTSTYTDWERQSRQFFGSHVDDPMLQIYLASNVVVQELPPTILEDSSLSALEAMEKLWNGSLEGHDPIVVVPVNVKALAEAQLDETRRIAETIRGKINVISKCTERNHVAVRVVLTHLDHLDGYSAFASFVEKESLSTILNVTYEPGADTEKALRVEIGAYAKHLPLALTSASADAYKRIVEFLERLPTVAGALGHFLDALLHEEPLSHAPKLTGVYMGSSAYRGRSSNPFYAELDLKRGIDPLRVHFYAAAALAVACFGYFLSGFILESGSFLAAYKAEERYMGTNQADRDVRARKDLADFRQRAELNPKLKWFPSFFNSAEAKFDRRFAEKTREKTIQPALARSLENDDAHRRSLFFLALLYSSRDNALGELVQRNEQTWAEVTGLDPDLLGEFVLASRTAYNRPVSLVGLPSQVQGLGRDWHAAWAIFFRDLGEILKQRALAPQELRSIQERARALMARSGTIRGATVDRRIVENLDSFARIDAKVIYGDYLQRLQPALELNDELGSLEGFLESIIKADISPPEQADSSFKKLATYLSLTLDASIVSSETYQFDFGEHEYAFAASSWERLIRNSQVGARIRQFLDTHADPERSVFFSPEDVFSDVTMNPRNDGTFLFTGKAQLDGQFTRMAFDERVGPVIDQLVRILDVLEIDPNDERRLAAFVRDEVQRYARDYRSALDDYYKSFDMKATSEDAVRVLARQILRVPSPVDEFLETVHHNANLKISDHPLSKPLREALAAYKPLIKITTPEPDGSLPEIARYRGIVEQLLISLTPGAKKPGAEGAVAMAAAAKTVSPASASAAPAKPPGPDGKSAAAGEDLVSLLSPSGKLALKILRREKGSFQVQMDTWLASVGLIGETAKPFRAVIDQAYLAGLEDVERSVADAWRYQIMSKAVGVLSKFPFDRASPVDATSDEVAALFHPQTGLFYDLFRRYIEPVSRVSGTSFTKKRSVLRTLEVPESMYDTINRVAKLSNELWDVNGQPRGFRIRLAPVPFPAIRHGKNELTLVYMKAGSVSVFNFNQTPFMRLLEIDWAKLQTSQVVIQFTNTTTQDKSYPTPVSAPDSYWSFLHLLERGESSGNVWSWEFKPGGPDGPSTQVRFQFGQDPWDLFNIRPQLRTFAETLRSSGT